MVAPLQVNILAIVFALKYNMYNLWKCMYSPDPTSVSHIPKFFVAYDTEQARDIYCRHVSHLRLR